MKSALLTTFLFCLSIAAIAQQVTVRGQVIHAEDPTFNLLIVNKNTAKGVFGAKDGSFVIQADKNDTLLIGALGYKTRKISLADSASKDEYNIRIYLSKIQIDLKEVQVFPKRELDSIQKDIQTLGFDERDYMLTGINALNSPLTYLYYQISRKERMRRRAYEIINEDRKRSLLRELLVQYVDHDIIDLQQEEFEDFVDFINLPDQVLISMTQYDFVIYTKKQFREFRNRPTKLRQDIDTHD